MTADLLDLLEGFWPMCGFYIDVYVTVNGLMAAVPSLVSITVWRCLEARSAALLQADTAPAALSVQSGPFPGGKGGKVQSFRFQLVDAGPTSLPVALVTHLHGSWNISGAHLWAHLSLI